MALPLAPARRRRLAALEGQRPAGPRQVRPLSLEGEDGDVDTVERGIGCFLLVARSLAAAVGAAGWRGREIDHVALLRIGPGAAKTACGETGPPAANGRRHP